MPFFTTFMQSILPGNYALTKSMELTKVQNSGTLWYTKKFLTLYYFVFLSNDIYTTQYKQKIINIFDSYIQSLDEEIQQAAELYFYSEDPATNFKSEQFNLFSNFASRNVFDSPEERDEYNRNAKKYYFALLMGSGGQSGVKKILKEAVRQPGFVYSHEIIESIIFRAAIESCVFDVNTYGEIRDKSIKYILSRQTMDEASRLASARTITAEDVIAMNEAHPHECPKYRALENDMPAFIRNERQILYYYGFFHSRTTGQADFEFSSLTPIGEMALNANSYEFLAIWEHQKIKMISQAASAEIMMVNRSNNPPEEFGISFTPYTDILGHLLRHGSLTISEYMYIVSRRKHRFSKEEWQDGEDELLENIDTIRAAVSNFGRERDVGTEDGSKELKKYILGIRNDLGADLHHNPLNAVKFINSGVSVENRDILTLLYEVYSKLDDYKTQKYLSVFSDCETDLRRRYIASVSGETSDPDARVKIYWDLYNIHPDNFILLSSVIAISAVQHGIYRIDGINRETLNAISEFAFSHFHNLLRTIGARTLPAVRRELQKAITALCSGDFSNYLIANEEGDRQILARYREEGTTALQTRIEEISHAATVSPAENRERNSTLIGMLKSLYMLRFAENNMLRCECCGEETFITEAGEPYVEFHHLIPFGIVYGPDHYLNLFALCPNCHKKIHFLRIPEKDACYEGINSNNYFHIRLTERLRELKAQNLLRSYHLEYLLADHAISQDEYNIVAA